MTINLEEHKKLSNAIRNLQEATDFEIALLHEEFSKVLGYIKEDKRVNTRFNQKKEKDAFQEIMERNNLK